MQGLYQWLLTANEADDIAAGILAQDHMARADKKFFNAILPEVMAQSASLDASLQPYLDREATTISPIEHAILWVAAFELLHHPETPFRVILNEAVEIAKVFGGTDGHKYVNGVLDKLAAAARPVEVAARG